MEERFPVWAEIHCYLILGNVLLARIGLLAAGHFGVAKHLLVLANAQPENSSRDRKTFFMSYIHHGFKKSL